MTIPVSLHTRSQDSSDEPNGNVSLDVFEIVLMSLQVNSRDITIVCKPTKVVTLYEHHTCSFYGRTIGHKLWGKITKNVLF